QNIIDNRGFLKLLDLLVLTVATEGNDALERLLRSAHHNNFNVKVLGLGTTWKGGDVSKFVGGGQKVKLLREELKQFENDEEQLVLFVDAYDVIFMDTKERLLEEYKQLGFKVLFGAEGFCWPQEGLEKIYPMVKPDEKRFLNSGSFMGPASYLYKLVTVSEIDDEDDDQLYYTNIFLNEATRKELNIGLDKSSVIFQNLNGVFADIELRFSDTTGYLYNTKTNTKPIVAHGNGPIKTQFNSLTNYLDFTWTPTRGCQHCEENTIDLSKPELFPIIQISIFLDQATPFLDVFFERFAELTYPKNRIHLTIYVAAKAEKQRGHVEAFNNTHGHEYRTATWLDKDEAPDTGSAYDRAFAHCLAIENCQFMLVLDSTVQLTSTNTIEHLIRMNRSMIAPMVTRRGKLWSNFWGALSKDGYYDRSDDYVQIVEGEKRGIWNVPFIRDVYLISRPTIRKMVDTKLAGNNEVDMRIAQNAREKDWEEQYVHPDYLEMVASNVTMKDFEQPCPDVFYVPLVSEKFSRQLIDEMETFGEWSDGSNNDPRLEGGYENVPTRDIHMRQVGWEEHWLHFLVKYVHPIQKILFKGYEDKPWARMNFVVRYRPTEQPSLREHHDASSYSVNIALNEQGPDYEGGGTRFIRYDCSVTGLKVGWASIFPGRVTHLHEGLTTTKGTRYIFVTFVNP
ncbi:Procollagen-lysine, partial [Paragonimus skrjabini miyazakii]